MNQAKYDGMTDEEKAAIDAIAGRPLSKSAEDGWNARAQQVIEQISAMDDNTVYTLSDDERAAFEALTYPVADQIIADGGYEDVLKTMQGM